MCQRPPSTTPALWRRKQRNNFCCFVRKGDWRGEVWYEVKTTTQRGFSNHGLLSLGSDNRESHSILEKWKSGRDLLNWHGQLLTKPPSTLKSMHKTKNERVRAVLSGRSEIWHDFARASSGIWCKVLYEQKGVKPLLCMKSQMTSRQQNEKMPWFHFLLCLDQMTIQLWLWSLTEGSLQFYAAQDFSILFWHVFWLD